MQRDSLSKMVFVGAVGLGVPKNKGSPHAVLLEELNWGESIGDAEIATGLADLVY